MEGAGRGGRDEDGADGEDWKAEMRALGITERDIAAQAMALAAPAAAADAGDGLWPWHVRPFRAFLAARNQWRTVAAGLAGFRFLGIDHAGAEASLRMAGLALQPQEFEDFEVIAAEAAALLNRRLEAKRP